MPKTKAQGRHKRKRFKKHKPPKATSTAVTDTPQAASETEQGSPSAGHGHDGHAQYSSNWNALAMQLGLDATRKKDRHDSTVEDRAEQPESTESFRMHNKKKRVVSKSRTKAPQTDTTLSTSDRKRERSQIWFDDVPLDMVAGEPIPKRSKLSSVTRLVTGNDKIAGKVVSLDCEMVGTGRHGDFSMLARCSIVNHHGNVLYDSYVAPMDRVTDYRTEFSGIRPRDLVGAPDFKTVQKSASDLLSGRKLVGHGIQNDLKVLLLSHPKKDIRDTSKYKPFRSLSQGGTPSLCKLATEILGIEIHDKEHDSIEDARIAMRLYQQHKKEWEDILKARHKTLRRTVL